MAIRSIHFGPIEDCVQFDDADFYSDTVTPMGLIVPVKPTTDSGVVRKVDLTDVTVNPAPGSNTQVIFNDSSAFGADAGLTYVKGTDVLNVTGGVKTAKIFPVSDGTTAVQLTKADGSTLIVNIDSTNKRVGIDVASPSARLHLPAGTTSAGTAPLKLTTQASGLTSVEQGAVELIGNSLQFTQLAKRRGVSMGQNVRTSTTTVENTASESAALITAEHGAGYLEVGKLEELVLIGTIEQRSNPNASLTVRVKYAGSTQHTIVTPASTLISAATPFRLTITTTCRSTGGSGSMQINSFFEIGGLSSTGGNTLTTIDTTTAQDTTVTVQWGEADVSDIFILHQARVLCIDSNK